MAGNKQNVKIGSVWVAYKQQGGPFRWLGYSEGGPGLNYTADTSDMFVDQLTTALFTNVTSETLELTFPSVETTQENIALTFPGAVIRGNSVDIYPASNTNQAAITGIVLVHPVFAGQPVGDVFDPTDPNYNSEFDIMFYGTPTASLDISFTREDMLHLPVTFRATVDPMGRMAVWGDPMANDFEFDPIDDSGTVGTPVSISLAPTGGQAPYTYTFANVPGFSLSGSTLTFESDIAGEFSTIVYAKDATGKIAQVIATVEVE